MNTMTTTQREIEARKIDGKMEWVSMETMQRGIEQFNEMVDDIKEYAPNVSVVAGGINGECFYFDIVAYPSEVSDDGLRDMKEKNRFAVISEKRDGLLKIEAKFYIH